MKYYFEIFDYLEKYERTAKVHGNPLCNIKLEVVVFEFTTLSIYESLEIIKRENELNSLQLCVKL